MQYYIRQYYTAHIVLRDGLHFVQLYIKTQCIDIELENAKIFHRIMD